MFIKKLLESDFDKYDELVSLNGTVFNTRDWLSLFGDRVKIFCIFDNDHNLLGGFHLYQKKSMFCKIQLNPPFTPFIGPFFLDRSQTSFKKQSYRKQVLTLIADTLSKEKTCMQIYSLNRDIVNTMPFKWKKFDVWPRYTYRINLKQPLEKILAAMSDSRRNDMTRAERDGIVVNKTTDSEEVKDLIYQTAERKNLKRDISLKQKIIEIYSQKKNSISCVSYKSNKPISTAFCVYDQNTAYYMFSGYDTDDKHHGAGALVIWNCIKEAKRLGLEFFDFDGSVVPHLEKYFRGFGGELVPFYRISKLNYFVKLGLLLSGKTLS
jgi:lipid II:glycine glycyltransferase (peptidoglycan interpeptide bridge formation enzyme)